MRNQKQYSVNNNQFSVNIKTRNSKLATRNPEISESGFAGRKDTRINSTEFGMQNNIDQFIGEVKSMLKLATRNPKLGTNSRLVFKRP
jgi:hypothetical protein